MPLDLEGWLTYIEGQHSKAIALGLERLREVSQRLGQTHFCPVITVAGTNGKGSTCAMLERIFISAGYRVGLYTSPHLLRYNERVRIQGDSASDDDLCASFLAVDRARGDIPLTYFEFGTLAAWEVFSQAKLDVVILEVGLGGRLDAVNLYDADCAIVTTVDMDHMEFLGNTREAIGFEKAGIFRSGKPAIFGDIAAPATLVGHAESIGAKLRLYGQDFVFKRQDHQWQFQGSQGKRNGLAYPGLRGQNQLLNASAVLEAVDAMRDLLPVAMQDIRRGLLEVELTGRFQVVPGRPTVVLDVAHNPQAARVLADNLSGMAFHPETWGVLGMLKDKDIAGVVKALKGRVTRWMVCNLDGPRAADSRMLEHALLTEGVTAPIECFASPAQALGTARERAGEDDRIVAFGSFLTVAEVLRALGRNA